MLRDILGQGGEHLHSYEDIVAYARALGDYTVILVGYYIGISPESIAEVYLVYYAVPEIIAVKAERFVVRSDTL